MSGKRVWAIGRPGGRAIGLLLGLVLLAGPGRGDGGAVAASPAGPLDEAEPPTGELWVQNMSSIDPQTAVAARFFDSDRSYDFSNVLLPPPPRSTDLLRVGSIDASLPAGRFGAQLVPSMPVPSGAIARNEWPATGAAMAYAAVEADAALTLPFVARGFGAARMSTRVTIQNARNDRAVALTLRFTALGDSSPSLELPRSLPASASLVLDLAHDAELASLPEGFGGSLSVQAEPGGRIAAEATTALETSAQASFGVAGTSQATLGSRLVAPRVLQGHAETRASGAAVTLDSFIAVANAGSAPAAVTLTYRGMDRAGNPCAGSTLVHGGSPHNIAAGGVALFGQGYALDGAGLGTSPLPDGCLATAIIQADGAELAATVIEVEAGGARASAYPALASALAKRDAFLPLARRGYDDLSTSIQVMNAGDQVTLAQLKINVVGEGRTIVVDRSVSLEPGAAASWDLRDFAEIPDASIGAVKLSGSRADVPLVALARERSDVDRRDDAAYPALAEPEKIDNPAPIPDIYQPYFAPSVWHSRVYDLGLLATGTTPSEIARVKAALNAQAFDFARRTGLTIAVSVQPYMFGGLPFQDWLQTQIDSDFADADVQARSWLVGLNYNAVTLLGRSGRLSEVDAAAFLEPGDFLDDAWALNFVTGGDRPLALPWMRVGCSPNYRNLALLATAKEPALGLELMDYLVDAAQQRENYQPQAPAKGQIGYPTLKALYGEFGIVCPAAPEVLRTAPERIEAVVDEALDDADRLAQTFGALEVDLAGDAANAAKAAGVVSSRWELVTQPMVNAMSDEDMDRRLRSAAGLVVGTLSLRALPTPLPEPTATETAEPTATETPEPSATASATETMEPGVTPSATQTPVPGLTPTGTQPARTPSPTPTTAGPTPTAILRPSPTSDAGTEAPPEPAPILLPYLARQHPGPEAAAGGAGRGSSSAQRVLQSGAEPAAFAVVWHRQPDGSIETSLVAEDGVTVSDPGGLGITIPPVDPGFPKSPEPEAWVQRGSVVVCFNVDQLKGCLTLDD